MHNVNPEGQGVGGSTGRSENVSQFFLEWERKINLTNVAKNPSQGQNTHRQTRNLFQSHKSNV